MRSAELVDRLEEAVVRKVVTIGPGASIHRVADALMIAKRNVRRLPITTKINRLLGIVSLRDLIAATQLTSICLL